MDFDRMVIIMKKFDIQFFAEGSGGDPAPSPAGSGEGGSGGAVFTEDYVHTLRRESSGYRTTEKTTRQRCIRC